MHKITNPLLGALCCALLLSTGCSSTKLDPVTDQYAAALSWMENSTEYRALCHQAFNAAGTALRKAASVKKKRTDKPLAVVLDLDETVLSNVRALAAIARESADFRELRTKLDNWYKYGRPDLIPGAREFIRLANQLQVKVFMVTNRSCEFISHTANVLQNEGVEYTSPIFCRATVSDKSPHFETIARGYNVVAYIGDQTTDFPALNQDGNKALDLSRGTMADSQMGVNYFILPNPVYGVWINRVHPKYFSLSPKDAVQAMRDSIKP